MDRHFKITITVAYDPVTLPDNMLTQLRSNVDRCIQRGNLLGDSSGEAVVDEYSAEVDEYSAAKGK